MPARILLADDSVTVQKVIELTFADEGMQVVAVGDGRRAIEQLETDPPDIVIADVSMPERDGYAVAAHVKQSPTLRHIPVILMTGAFEQLDEERARAVGCDGVLAKPFEPQTAIALVRTLLVRAGRQGGPAEGEVADASAAAFEPAPAIDDVFDRIDESLGVRPPASAGAVGAPSVPAPVAPAQTGAGQAGVGGGEGLSLSDRGGPAPPPRPSLADAFSRLLADELGEGPAKAEWAGAGWTDDLPAAGREATTVPPTGSSAASVVLSEAQLDDLARRVAARISASMVREVVTTEVIGVAERLVREEIARLKGQG